MRNKILLVGVIALFLLTRLYKITEIPASLYWDEASISFNAYSVMLTGKDEWGDFLPLHFRAFGEFKLPIYIYTVAFFEKIFGLSEFAVRFPAVMFSLASIILTYLLTFKILNKKSTALFAAFFMTVSPWFFIFSRTGYEATAGLMFLMLGIYLFSLKKNRFLILSVISFILSIYSYNAFRIITPLIFLLILPTIYYDSLVYHTKNISKGKLLVVFLSVIIFITSLFPVIRQMQSNDGVSRWQTISIFNDTKNGGEIFVKFTGNYLSHFNPDFLFISGDKNLRSQQEGFGQLYWVELPLLLAGLIFIFTRRKMIYFLPLLVVLLAPIPAAITKESPHALRGITVVPFISIISALGVSFLIEKFKKRLVLKVAAVVFFLVFFLNYFYNFIIFYPTSSAGDWQYGYKALFTEYNSTFGQYDHVIVSDFYGQPYIFALYYLRYHPEKLKAEVAYNSVDKWGFSTVASFNNFLFKKITLENLPSGRLLIFASPSEKLVNLKESSVVKGLNGNIAFYVYEYEK